jgi:hypothetical protein
MGVSLREVINECEKELEGLKLVADQYGDDIRCRHYQIEGGAAICLWLVNMPHCECTDFMMTGRENGYALLFKSVCPGVNIAPRQGHRLSTPVFEQHVSKRATTLKEVQAIFEKEALRTRR